MNYEIIKDPKKFLAFIHWLPELNPNEKYYVALLARNKYCSNLNHIKSDRMQLRRLLVTKEELYTKVKQMECEIGSYKQKDKEIPQEALALYINPNPRDLDRGGDNAMVKLTLLSLQPYSNTNPVEIVLSEVQNACSRKTIIDFDFDIDELECNPTIELIKTLLNESAYHILKTRGGFHLLVFPAKIQPEFNTTWYVNLRKIKGCDARRDNLIPVPGCSQGNFIPYFI